MTFIRDQKRNFKCIYIFALIYMMSIYLKSLFQRSNVGKRKATIFFFALSLLITYLDFYEIFMDPKFSNLLEVLCVLLFFHEKIILWCRSLFTSVVIFVSARLWWQKYKLQFEKEIHDQIETARAQNLTDEKIQEIILSDANLKTSSFLGEDEAYLLKMLSE